MKSSLEELIAFRAIVDTGSITAAAEQLGQTTSGVSRTLARLEEKLDTTLLRRTTRRISLTDEGELLLAHARRILAAMDEAEDQLARRRQTPSGRLRINAASPFMLHVLVPRIDAFRRAFPAIDLELNSDDLIIDLLEEDTDVAIRIGPLRDSTLTARALGGSGRRILASPEYLARHGTPARVEDLAAHTLLGFSQRDSLNQWPLRHADGDSLHIRAQLHASSGETLRQLALEGAGIVCLADFMTEADRARGDFMQVLAADTLDTRQAIHAVYYRNTALSARVGCFLDWLAVELLKPGTGIHPPRREQS